MSQNLVPDAGHPRGLVGVKVPQINVLLDLSSRNFGAEGRKAAYSVASEPPFFMPWH